MVRKAVQRADRDVLPASLNLHQMRPMNTYRRRDLRLRLPHRHTRSLHPLPQLLQPSIHMLTINHTNVD